MNDLLLALIRRVALSCEERHGYMPNTEEEASQFQPHQWVRDVADLWATEAYAQGRADQLRELETQKLWLWKNFIDGRPEFWAFDNPYPTRLDCGDPQTLGEPCGYAIFKPSRDGSQGRTEEQVLRAIARAR